jgi:hypothetical protein
VCDFFCVDLLSFDLGRGYFIVDSIEEIGKPGLDKVEG